MNIITAARQLSLLFCLFYSTLAIADQQFNSNDGQDEQSSLDTSNDLFEDGDNFLPRSKDYASANAAIKSIRSNHYDGMDGATLPVHEPTVLQQFEQLPLDRRPLFLQALLNTLNGIDYIQITANLCIGQDCGLLFEVIEIRTIVHFQLF